MKNTKGKWQMEDRSDKITQVISYDINTAEAKDICVVSDDWNEQVANANLIAAAPELFKALKAMTKLFEERVPYPNNTQRYKQAIKAIAKAEGEIK